MSGTLELQKQYPAKIPRLLWNNQVNAALFSIMLLVSPQSIYAKNHSGNSQDTAEKVSKIIHQKLHGKGPLAELLNSILQIQKENPSSLYYELQDYVDQIREPTQQEKVVKIINGIGEKKFLNIIKDGGGYKLISFFNFSSTGADTIIGTWKLVESKDISEVFKSIYLTMDDLMVLKAEQIEFGDPSKDFERQNKIFAQNIKNAVSR